MSRIFLHLMGACWVYFLIAHYPLAAQPISEMPARRWLKYHVEIPEDGVYTCTISISNATSKELVVWIEDDYDNPEGQIYDLTGKTHLPGTGSMGEFQTHTWGEIRLSAGFHRLKIHFNQVGVGINALRFTLAHP